MKKFSRTMSARLMATVLLAVHAGSLYFSVREGLRLPPVPVPLMQNERFSIGKPSDKTTLSQSGPLDVPSQTQKRSKRQVLDIGGPVATGIRNVVPEPSSLIENASPEIASVLFVKHPAGRAPPFLF